MQQHTDDPTINFAPETEVRADVLERHRLFWERRNPEPLLARLPHPRWAKKPYPIAGGGYACEPRRLRPSDVDIDRLLGADRLPDAPLIADYVQGVKTIFPVAWMETVIGCPVYAANTSCYARPADELDSDETSEWESVLDSVVRREVELADERFSALQLHLRGVVDMVAAFWGEERMCLTMFDSPESVDTLAVEFLNRFVETASRGFALRPAWHGGYVSHWGVFAPGPLLDYQIDATSILSPEQYRTYFAPVDAEILGSWRYWVTHLHACGLLMTDELLEMPGVGAYEISLERETGVWEPERVIDAVAKLQHAGYRIILNGELNDEELESMLSRLEPSGLAVFSWQPDPDYRPGA